MSESEKIFFHYTSIKGLLGIISSKSIWATDILYLNDASELNYSLDLLKEEIFRFQKTIQNVLAPEYAFYTMVIEQIYRFIPSERFAFFVCSFSEEKDLLSQWRGYCPEGVGFSIGFNFSKLSVWAKQNNCALKLCIYDADEQKNALVSLINKISYRYKDEVINIPKELRHKQEISLLVDLLFEFAELAPTCKHPKFREEKEWRIIARRDLKSNDVIKLIKYRDGKSMVVPFIEIPLPLEDDNLDIDQIMVGPTHDPDLSKASVEMLLKSKNINFGEIQFSTIPYRNW